MTNREWTARAKCAGDDLENYDLARWRDDRAARARELCQGCPVKAECAADALEFPAWGTVRAGLWLPDYHVAMARQHLGLYPELLGRVAAPIIYGQEEAA